MQENHPIQLPASTSTAVMALGLLMNGALVQHAGEVEGSGNIFHDPRLFAVWNTMSAKRCLVVCGIHDLEARQQFLSEVWLSCRRSTMWSSVSHGGFDIPAPTQVLWHPFWSGARSTAPLLTI